MTGSELALNALALLGEAEDERNAYADTRVLRCIQLLLWETLGLNNGLRAYAGREPLASITYTALTTPLPTEEALNFAVLPYGLAAKLIFEEDSGRAASLQNLYLAAAAGVQQTAGEQVVDVYGGEVAG